MTNLWAWVRGWRRREPAPTAWRTDDLVRVIAPGSTFRGEIGRVVTLDDSPVFPVGVAIFDHPRPVYFARDELEHWTEAL